MRIKVLHALNSGRIPAGSVIDVSDKIGQGYIQKGIGVDAAGQTDASTLSRCPKCDWDLSKSVEPDPVKVKELSKQVNPEPKTKMERIVDAIKTFKDDQTYFTARGLPKVGKIEQWIDTDISMQERDDAWDIVQKERGAK